jgi:hypothetical protein
MIKAQFERGRKEFAKWGTTHPNGRLAVIAAALGTSPIIVAAGMAAVVAVMPESTPSAISTPILTVFYITSILLAFVAPLCTIAACLILPFAAWRAYRDYRRRKKTALPPPEPTAASSSDPQ